MYQGKEMLGFLLFSGDQKGILERKRLMQQKKLDPNIFISLCNIPKSFMKGLLKEVYLEPCETSTLEIFAKTVHGF